LVEIELPLLISLQQQIMLTRITEWPHLSPYSHSNDLRQAVVRFCVVVWLLLP